MATQGIEGSSGVCCSNEILPCPGRIFHNGIATYTMSHNGIGISSIVRYCFGVWTMRWIAVFDWMLMVWEISTR